MSDAEGWYINAGNEQRGPMSFDELKILVKQGSLNRGVLVWSDGMPQWQPASSIKGLFAVPPPVQPKVVDQPQLLPEPSASASGRKFADQGEPIRLYEINIDTKKLLHLNSHATSMSVTGVVSGVLLLLLGYWLWAVAVIIIAGVSLFVVLNNRGRIPKFQYCVRDNVLQISEPPGRRDIPLDSIVTTSVASQPIPRLFGPSLENFESVVVAPMAGGKAVLRAILNAQEVSQVLLSRRR